MMPPSGAFIPQNFQKKRAGRNPCPAVELSRLEKEGLLLFLDLRYGDTFASRRAFNNDFMTNVLFCQSLIVQRVGFLVGGAVEDQLLAAFGALHGTFGMLRLGSIGAALRVRNPSGVLVMICHQGDAER
jgi:hypothetical protein